MSTVSRTRATAVGATAVLMWGVLALFTTLTGDVPPFLLTAIAFSIGGILMICKWILRGDDILSHLRQPLGAWVLGVTGLFGYHFLYFLALKSAPPVQAGLIAYLWPLLIVVFSALLPGEKLRWFHVIGAISGLVGTIVLVSGSSSLELNRSEYFGYFLALACAFTWSGYSVLNRRFGTVPTDTLGAFCIVVAVLSFIAHLRFEETIMPVNMIEWLAVIGLGLFPVGLAFFAWDYGTKHGDIQVL
ncbi:MAG: EamA family transporter, partial [Rhodobacterales bacterium]|nr:EamA family transporter [Rhodobacterales bacterium]